MYYYGALLPQILSRKSGSGGDYKDKLSMIAKFVRYVFSKNILSYIGYFTYIVLGYWTVKFVSNPTIFFLQFVDELWIVPFALIIVLIGYMVRAIRSFRK